MRYPSIREIEDRIGIKSETWRARCHEISLAAVRAGILGEPGPSCRVVRGWATGYGIDSQHSWIALGRPFDVDTVIIDVTAHAWDQVSDIVVSTVGESYSSASGGGRGHILHGYQPGSIWNFGQPESGDIKLSRDGLSDDANRFLDLLGPLSLRGWASLMSFPHLGWPAHEICEAIAERIPEADVLVPIDVMAHATDRNPSELYW